MTNQVVLKRLKEYGIPINLGMPEVNKSDLRDKVLVAKRINILSIFYAISENPESISFFKKLITDQGMESLLTTREQSVLNKQLLTTQQEIDFSWHKESIYTLAWSLGHIKKLIFPNQEINISTLYSSIPPEVELKVFISRSEYINHEQIYNEVEFYYRLHWALRHPESWSILNRYKMKKLNLSVVIERRKALEWIIGSSVGWDEVSLDT